MNFQHKYDLIEAELARVLGKEVAAGAAYDRAIEGAHSHGYLQEEALANELAGHFYLARGRTTIARAYLREAHYVYQRWGALAKVKDIEARYSQLLAHDHTSPATTTTTSSDRHPASTLDLLSASRAAQAISGELVLEQLLQQLLQIVIENAGADKGILIVERQSQLILRRC